jgi:hypothetical protein
MSRFRHRLQLVLPLLLLLTGLLALVPQVHPASAAIATGPIIVSIGDSVASGEGVPDSPQVLTVTGQAYPPTWLGFSDGNHDISDPTTCHRSTNSGPALAFTQIMAQYPHATFVSAACSGAGISDGLMGQQLNCELCTTAKVGTPQLQQVANWMAHNRPGRRIDALFVSIGANDAGFGDVVTSCIDPLQPPCNTNQSLIAAETQKLGDLHWKYDSLANAIQAQLNPVKVYITDYFDPTQKAAGVFCNGEPFADPLSNISGAEAQWASQFVIANLNANVEAAATRNAGHGWQVVGNIAPQFIGHAYCSGSTRFVNTVADSLLIQGDKNGSVHPNLGGHQVYGGALATAFLATVLTQSAPTLSLVAPSPTSVQLTWEDHSLFQQTFTQVQVSSGGTVTTVQLQDGNATSWQQAGLSGGQTYTYQERGCNAAGGCTPWSNQVSYTVPAPPAPTAPSNLKDTPVVSGAVYRHTLSWTLNAQNATSIVLYYEDDTTTTWNTLTLPLSTQFVLDSHFKLYHAYNIYVQACNYSGCSGPSNTIWVDIESSL